MELKTKATKDKKSQIRLITGISIVLFGTLGSLFWGLGIAFNNPASIFIGQLIMSTLPIILLIIQRFL